MPILTALGAPVNLADLPFGQKTIQVVVHYIPPAEMATLPIPPTPAHIAAMLANTNLQVVGHIGGHTPPTDADAVSTMSLEFTLHTPWGAPFSFSTPSQRLAAGELQSFGFANVYRFLAYVQLFHQTACICAQYGLALTPSPSRLDDRWKVPNMITLIWERYAIGLHVSYQAESGNFLESPTLYAPTMGSPYLHPSTAPSWGKYSKESRPLFFSKLSRHIETTLLNRLQC